MTTLDRIKELCDENLTTISKLEKFLGFGRGTITKWNKSKPSADKLNKVAKYFGVTEDYLLGKTDDRHEIIAGPMRASIKLSTITKPTIEKGPTEVEPAIEKLLIALSGEVKDLTDDEYEELIRIAKYVKWQRENS